MSKLLTRSQWKQRVGNLQPGDLLPEVPGMVKLFPAVIEIAKEADPTTGMADIKFIISTGTIDREDDIIQVDGWELDQYKKNPVVLYGHDYGGLPVAQAVEVGVEGDKLVATDRFTPQDVNPHGYMVYQLVRGKFLRATSVGFRPREWVYNDDHKGFDFSRQELLEHSIVPVPANPEALVAAKAEGIDLQPMIEWAEKILDDPASDRVALWLPRETVEAMRKAAGAVAPTQIETGTPGDAAPPSKATEEPAPAGAAPPAEETLTETEEALMKEAIKALTVAVAGLEAGLEALPDTIAGKITEAMEAKAGEEPAAPAAEMTEDEVRAIVRAATEEVVTATTGKLPE